MYIQSNLKTQLLSRQVSVYRTAAPGMARADHRKSSKYHDINSDTWAFFYSE